MCIRDRQNALACVFTSGCIFMLLSVFRVQQKIVDAVPDCVKKSIGAGVGLFIAFSGFQSAGIAVSYTHLSSSLPRIPV